MIIFAALGLAVAWGIHTMNADEYDPKIAILKAGNFGYLYLAVWIFGLTGFCQQVFVALGRKKSMADNPDQYIFETVGKPNEPYVRLVSSGAVGEFNRAQRGIDNSREGYPQVLVNAV